MAWLKKFYFLGVSFLGLFFSYLLISVNTHTHGVLLFASPGFDLFVQTIDRQSVMNSQDPCFSAHAFSFVTISDEKPTPATRMTLSHTKLTKPPDSVNMFQAAATPQISTNFKSNLSPLQYNYNSSPPIGHIIRDTSGGAGNAGSRVSSNHHSACSERKCSSLCHHLHKKTKTKTAKEIEDEEKRISLLLTRIRCKLSTNSHLGSRSEGVPVNRDFLLSSRKGKHQSTEAT